MDFFCFFYIPQGAFLHFVYCLSKPCKGIYAAFYTFSTSMESLIETITNLKFYHLPLYRLSTADPFR